MDKKLCNVSVKSRNPEFLFPLIYQCEKQAKYRVSYINPVNKKLKEEVVCGTHKNKLEKFSERVFKKTGFDIKINIVPID